MLKTVTFTANLLAETTYEFSRWNEGRTQRAKTETFQVGGKGINVSKMLNKLGADNQALCFPGGDFGPACERWLEGQGIETLAFHEGCVARSGSVVRGGGQDETTFLGVDSIVSEDAIREAVAELEAIEGPFLFAVCGSVQGWENPIWDCLRDWVKTRGEEVTLVVDNYGASLPWFAKQGPALVKVNRDELELLFDGEERTLETPVLLKKARTRFSCDRWVVTNGAQTIWVLEGLGDAKHFEPDTVECISPVGCGDIVFATLIDCLYNRNGYSLLEAARLASEYASRSAAMPGIAEFDL